MTSFQRLQLSILTSILFILTLANADIGFPFGGPSGGPFGGGGSSGPFGGPPFNVTGFGGWNACPPWWHTDACNTNNNNDSGGNNGSNNSTNSGTNNGNNTGVGVDPGASGYTASDFNMSNRIIAVHAVLASLVWVLFIPSVGILLRIGLKSPWIVRLHALLQSISYVIFVAAAALGIWLVQHLSYGRYNLWNDPHTRLGVAILAIAFLQPFIGMANHFMFKKRVKNLEYDELKTKPGRTILGQIHIWVGRSLIIMGMVNGGLGIRLASVSPFANNQRSKAIAYGVCAGFMFLLYVIIVVVFEVRKTQVEERATIEPKDQPAATTQGNVGILPTYDQSQETISKDHGWTARYQ